MTSYNSNLVVSDYVPPTTYSVSKVLRALYSQSNGIFMSSGSSVTISGESGYYWQASSGSTLSLLGLGSVPSVKAVGAAGSGAYPTNSKWTTQQSGTPTYEVDTQEGIALTAIPGFVLNGINSTIDPSLWPIGSLGTYIQGALSSFGTMPSDALCVHDMVWNENDSTGSTNKSTFFKGARQRMISGIFRAANPLPNIRQPVFLGWSSFTEGINPPGGTGKTIANMMAAELALVNAGLDVHFAVGNPFDSIDRGLGSHMTDQGDFNYQARAMFQRVRRLSEKGFGTTNAHQWMIGLGARISGWTVPAAKTAYVKIAPDRNDDIVPQANFNARVWSIQDGSTTINVLSCGYLNSTTFVLTLDGTPSAAAVLTFCQTPGFFGTGSLPSCNFHTKLPYFPDYAQTIMKAQLTTPVPIQRLDAPLLRDAVAGINADNVQLGNLSHGGTSIIITPPAPVTTPPAITIAAIADFTVGVNLTVSGTYAGAVPTLGYYVDKPLDASGNVVVTAVSLPSPLTGGVWTLSLAAALFPAGAHNVTIVETNAPTVYATSNSFNAVAAVTTFTPAVFDPTTMKGQDFTTASGFDTTVWNNVFTQVASGVNAGFYFSKTKDGLWITSTGAANSSTVNNGATNQKNWPQSGFQNAESGLSAGHGYGTFHIRARAGQKTQGAGINGIMWRSDGKWLDESLGNQFTEIDIFEAWSSNGTSVSTLHYYDPTVSGYHNGQLFNGLTYPSGTDNTTMRDYDVVWKAGSLALYIDGVLQYNNTSDHVPLDYAHGDCNRTLGAQVVIQTSTQPLQTIQLFVANAWWSPSTAAPGSGAVATPIVSGPSVTVPVPNPFNVGTQTFAGTVSGIASTAVTLSLQWSVTQPSAGSSGWVSATITGASAPYSFTCKSVPVTNGGTAGTLWALVGGTTVLSCFTATPIGAAVVVPPTVTVKQPTTLLVGTNDLTVSATGTYKLIELCWGDPVVPPLSGDAGWISMSPTTFVAPVFIVGDDAGLLGGLWYRIDGVIATFPSFTATPSIPNAIGLSSVVNSGVAALYAGYPLYVYGSWEGPTQPTALAYFVDSTGVVVSPPPATGTLGLTVLVDVPNKKCHLLMYKNTGGTNSVRANLDTVYIGEVYGSMPDGEQSTSIALPAVGTHTVGIYLDGNTATASCTFTVNATAGSTVAIPAAATITSDGFYSFMIQAGLTQGTHTLTVVRTDDSTVTAQSASLVVAAATGTIPVVTYPSVQSSVVAPIVRPGFNPNLNLLWGNEQFDNFWKDPRDWANTVDLAYSGKGGVGGYRNQPCWRKTFGSYGQVGAYADWAIPFRIVMSVSARPGSSTILDIFTNPGHDIFAAGEPFLFWIPSVADDGGVEANTTFPFAGWSFPLKQILTVVDSTSTTWVDSTGTPIKNSSGVSQTVHKYGIQLPSGTTVPSGFYWDNRAAVAAKVLTNPILYCRHNSFYTNSVTKQPPWQVAQMLDVAQYGVCAAGGVFVYGGDQGEPTYRDYWRERNNFGDVIAYAFLAGEMEYVGNRIRNFPDPSLVAIEMENEPTGPWTNQVNGVENGVRDQIVNFQIPGWRAAAGPNVTIIVKGTAYGSLAWALATFDIVFPNDGPYCIACHIYDRQQNKSTHYPDVTIPAASNYNTNGTQLYFTGDTDAQYVADALTVLKVRTGATIAGLTEFGIAWDYTIPSGATYGYSSSNEPFRMRMIAQVFSKCANAGHFVFNWNADDDGIAKTYLTDGLSYQPGDGTYTTTELLIPVARNECALANTCGSLTGVSVSTVFPAYSPPALTIVPTYRLSATNSVVSATPGTSVTAPIVLASTHTYGGTVTLSTNPPTGISVSLSSSTFTNIGSTTGVANGSNIATATITVAGSVAPGNYSIPVTATDGTLVRNDSISLTVAAATVAPSFALSPATATVPVVQGASVTTTLTLTPAGNYTATDTLSICTLPTGVTGSLSTTSVANGSGSVVLTLNASSSTAVGNVPVTVTATDGTLTQTSAITLAVSAPPVTPSYSLTPMTSSHSVAQGASAAVTFTLAAVGGYTGTDTVSVSGLPTGVTSAISPASVTNGSGTFTVTFTATSGATIATTTVTVAVTDGTLARSATVSLGVVAAPVSPTFTMSPTSATVALAQGASKATTFTFAASGGYSGTDTVSVSGLPSGVTASLSSTSISNGSGSTVLTLTASSTATIGSATVTVSATDGTITDTSSIALNVSAPPVAATYTLSPTTAAAKVNQGANTQVVLSLTASGSYTGSDVFSIAGLPSGVSAAFSPTSLVNGTGTTTLTLAAASGATLGTTYPAVTVTDGTISRTCTINLAVNTPPASPTFALTPAVASVSVVQGTSAGVTVTLTPSGGYTGTDTISYGTLPTGITAALSAASISNGAGSSTLTFTAAATAAVGNTAVPIYVTDGTITQSCVVTLTVSPTVVVTNAIYVDPQNPVYTSTSASFSGHNADPTKTLQIEYLATGMGAPGDAGLIHATVNSNGSWSVAGVPVGPTGANGTLWAIIGGTTAVSLETIVPVAPPVVVVPVVSPLKVGPTIVSTDGSGIYSLGCGAVSGGVTPLTFQFYRVVYSAGTTGPAQPVGPSGPLTTYQDASLPLNSTAGYYVTVTDSSIPPQVITTAPNVITYGTPTGGSTSGVTLDQLSAQLALVLGNTQTLVSNDASQPTGSF